ncbi:MAG: recombination regulator RecX [Armatimonadetes bacterium]|nr:recombination regulator RecX [Armatimonadota bacterium]MCX7967252.1 recombination regulator RecX [Armatimonadota bacterium]MDW8142420.1 regulatory protein RecX [Armatimonadota bacterium]
MRGHRRQKALQEKTEAIEKAKTAAIRLLRYRPRSERELLARLKAKGWDDSIAQEVVARFKDVGLVDDRQMAELFVQSALSDTQPHSRFEVRYKLRSLGISDEIVEEVLSLWTDEVEYQMAERYIKRRLAGTPNPKQRDIQRAFRAAMQKGFELSAIRSAIRSFGDLQEID